MPLTTLYRTCYFFNLLICLEFLISLYVIRKANTPIKNIGFQVLKHGLRAIAGVSLGAGAFTYGPVEPNLISNYVHTKTPLGRGYDYEIGSMPARVKGDILTGVIGNEKMNAAVDKYNQILGFLMMAILEK